MTSKVILVETKGISMVVEGVTTRAQGISAFREMAEREKAQAEHWLSIPDSEFEVFSCYGSYAQRKRVDLP